MHLGRAVSSLLHGLFLAVDRGACLFFTAVIGLLISVAPPVAEYRLWGPGSSSCSGMAQQLRLPGPGAQAQ